MGGCGDLVQQPGADDAAGAPDLCDHFEIEIPVMGLAARAHE